MVYCSKITTIAFDVGNVLVSNKGFPWSILRPISQSLDIPIAKLAKRYDLLLPEMEKGNQKIYSLIGKRLSPRLRDLYVNAAQNIFQLNTELFNTACELKKNFKVGIISNIDQYLSQIPVHFAVYSCFDPKLVVLSYKVKARKPNPEIYRLFLKRAKSLASECLFVDDKKENIVAAQKIGMKTILFKNNTQFKKELFNYLLPGA